MTARTWRQRARCVGYNTELFFPPAGRGADADTARAICSSCSVRRDCLTDALDKVDIYGIRGGLTGEEREDLLRFRAPGT